jgi:hypothetical protein
MRGPRNRLLPATRAPRAHRPAPVVFEGLELHDAVNPYGWRFAAPVEPKLIHNQWNVLNNHYIPAIPRLTVSFW